MIQENNKYYYFSVIEYLSSIIISVNKQVDFYVNFVMPMDPKAIIVRDVTKWMKALVNYSCKPVKRQISLSWDHPDGGCVS